MNMPIEAFRSLIIEQVRCNEVTIVVGQTGSGKTTKLPRFLYEAGFAKDGIIGVTEPRRIAAISVANHVAKELNIAAVKNVVGHKVRFDDVTDRNTAIKFMTDGILLRELRSDPLLSRYSLIMLDEAHERSVNTDFLLSLLKQVLRLRKDLKVVIASATIDADKFSGYFWNAPVMNIGGRQHEVAIVWDKKDHRSVGEILKRTVAKIIEIHANEAEGDILVFLAGIDEIRGVNEVFREKQLPGLIVLPAHGDLSSEEQQMVFEQYPGNRKVVLATNIAETSITIDGIVHVVDTGLVKQTQLNPATGIENLEMVEHSRAGCDQRTGRAGRTGPGVCHRLFTRRNFNRRPAFTTPEIQRVSLASTVLALEALEIPDIRNFDFIDMPPQDLFEEAYGTLEAFGAIEKGKSGLTRLGEEMALLPLAPRIARMVLAAKDTDCVEDVATIAAFLSYDRRIFTPSRVNRGEAEAAHQKFKDSRSDMLTFLSIWGGYEATEFDKRWCFENFLSFNALEEVRMVRDQLLWYLRRLGMKVAHSNDESVILRAVSAGFAHNLLSHVDGSLYRGVFRNIREVAVSSGSAIFDEPDKPRWVVAAKIAAVSRTKAYHCSSVLPEWLPEIAPTTFQFSRYELRSPPDRKGNVVARRRVVSRDSLGQETQAGEALETVSLKKARKIQEEAIREAEALGWRLLVIRKAGSSPHEMRGCSKEGETYPLSETVPVSAERGDKWYCELDPTIVPGKLYAQPRFQLFDLEKKPGAFSGLQSDLVRKIMSDLHS